MITAIEQALQRCSGDKFANICRLYLAYRYPLVNASGFVTGKEKSKKGTPDNFIADGDYYIFNEVTTIDKKQLIGKLKSDVTHCFRQKEIPANCIYKIILICNEKITTKIQKEVTEHKNTINSRSNIEIIGIDALATSIFRDFPSIGRELGLSLDTGQILEIDDFVSQYEKSKFATPLSNNFYNRSNEINNGLRILNQNDYLLITGQAGVGKTKFSLELVKNFVQHNPNFIVKYIRNNNQLIWDDLKIQLTKNKKYLIVVDDANKLKSNLTSIINFKKEFEEGSIKIVLTVRNYLKKVVENELKNYQSLELSNFDKAELTKILQSPDFNINNYYTDRIFSISKGNPRIALMAAIAGINKDLEKLNKASLILEEYFSSVNKSFKDDLTLLKVAGILSLFKSVDISNSNQIDEIEKYFKISKNELIEKLNLLVENELADEFKNIYKVTDQILGEYIFYLIFIKEKHISFILLLDLYFDEHKISLMRLLNPIISNYGFEEVRELIIFDLNAKWNSLKNDKNKAVRFLESFWFYLQTDTILYVNNYIKSLNQIDLNSLKFEIYKDNHLEAYDDKIISLLVNFQNFPDKFEIALDLLLKYGLSNDLLFTKVLKVFKQSFTYKRFSYEYGYKIQIKLFDFLYSKVDENPILYSKIIIFIADKYLVDTYQYNEGGDGNKIYFGQEHILLINEYKEFRKKLFIFIFGCFKDENLKENVYEFFERHQYSHFHQREKRVITFDKNLIVHFFLKNFINNSFRESSIIRKYTRTFDHTKIRYSKKVKELIASKEFKLWLLLDEKGEDNEEKVIEIFDKYNLEEYLDFLNSLNVIYLNKINHFSGYSTITNIVSIILENLANKNFDIFLPVLEKVFEYEYSSNILLGRLLSKIEYNDHKLEQLKKVFLKNKKTEGLLLDLFIRVPQEFTTIADYNFVINFLKREDFTNIYFIDNIIRKLEFLDVNAEDEIVKIIELLIFKIKANNNLSIYPDFFKLINEKYQSIFISHLDKIELLYLYFDSKRRQFDYDLEVLKIILTYDPIFITTLLKYNFDNKDYFSQRDFDENDFKRLWKLDNYDVVFEKMINYLIGFNSHYVNRAEVFSKAFNGNNSREIDFLKNKLYVTKDNKMIKFLFNIVTSVYRDKMLDFLKIILEKGCDIELFKKLDFYTAAGVTIGSRLPSMQFELSQLEKVKQFLEDLKDINYYEFIELIEKDIMYVKIGIDRERKDEFVSEWD